MGEAIVGALIQADIFSPSMIYVSDPSSARVDLMRETYQVHAVDENAELFSICDIVILAVKPQQMDQVLSQIREQDDYAMSGRKLVISIAAGTPIRKIEALLYPSLDESARKRLPIIRVMPNTPALVLAGMSGMSPNPYATEEDVRVCKTILEAMGKVIEFEEENLDAVTGVSGSGPAYVFYVIESMTEAGIKVGLDPDDAAVLTLETLDGAIRLMRDRGEPPEELRRKVTSPGGTTQAALEVLENHKVKQSIIEAIEAATRRSKELSM